MDEEPVTPVEVAGRWEMLYLTEDDSTQKISFDLILGKDDEPLCNGILHNCWDFENSRKCISISGISKLGIAYWGKYMQ